VLASGRFLYLGSEKGLALFDVTQKVSQANITRFGDQVDLSVLSLLRRTDTLYIGTPQGVYKAGVDFSDPLNPAPRYGSLLDPKRWRKVDFSDPPDTSGTKRRYDFLAFVGESLATFGPGMMLDKPVKVKVFLGDSLRIGKNSYEFNWLNCAAFSGGRLFLGGQLQLIYSPQPFAAVPWMQYLAPSRNHPFDTLANVAAYNGTVWGQGVFGLNRFKGLEQGFLSIQPDALPSFEIATRFLKNLSMDVKGDVYAGSWGEGMQRVR
jgi:hypothetical protein